LSILLADPKRTASATANQALRWITFRAANGSLSERRAHLGVLDPRYCLPDEVGLTESWGMTYHHIPVDFKAPLFENLEKFFDVMDASHDKRVFVHCAANYRVSAFIALYGQARLGWSVDEATAHITRLWDPNDTWKEFIEVSRRSLQVAPDTPCNRSVVVAKRVIVPNSRE
jgi:hypothetical protein